MARGILKPSLKKMNKIIEKVKGFTQEVIVSFSCGKDSIVCLDLCVKNFKKVFPYFLFHIPGLSFQEQYLKYVEKKYGIEILRLPHFELGKFLKKAAFRNPSLLAMDCPAASPNEIENYVRSETKVDWVCHGYKISDSPLRGARIKKCGGVEEKFKRFFPAAHFNDAAVWNYIRNNKILIPADYSLFKRSFGFLEPRELSEIKKKFPEDYLRIKEIFPHVEAIIKRGEIAENNKASKVSG